MTPEGNRKRISLPIRETKKSRQSSILNTELKKKRDSCSMGICVHNLSRQTCTCRYNENFRNEKLMDVKDAAFYGLVLPAEETEEEISSKCHQERKFYWRPDNPRRHWCFRLHCELLYFPCRCPALEVPSQLGRYLWYQYIVACKPDDSYIKKYVQVLHKRIYSLQQRKAKLNCFLLFDYGISLTWLDYSTRKDVLTRLEKFLSSQDQLHIVGMENALLPAQDVIRLLLSLSMGSGSCLKSLYLWMVFNRTSCPLIGYFPTYEEYSPYLKKPVIKKPKKWKVPKENKGELTVINLTFPLNDEPKIQPRRRRPTLVGRKSDSPRRKSEPLNALDKYLNSSSQYLRRSGVANKDTSEYQLTGPSRSAEGVSASDENEVVGDDELDEEGEYESSVKAPANTESGVLSEKDQATIESWMKSLVLSGIQDATALETWIKSLDFSGVENKAGVESWIKSLVFSGFIDKTRTTESWMKNLVFSGVKEHLMDYSTEYESQEDPEELESLEILKKPSSINGEDVEDDFPDTIEDEEEEIFMEGEEIEEEEGENFVAEDFDESLVVSNEVSVSQTKIGFLSADKLVSETSDTDNSRSEIENLALEPHNDSVIDNKEEIESDGKIREEIASSGDAEIHSPTVLPKTTEPDGHSADEFQTISQKSDESHFQTVEELHLRPNKSSIEIEHHKLNEIKQKSEIVLNKSIPINAVSSSSKTPIEKKQERLNFDPKIEYDHGTISREDLNPVENVIESDAVRDDSSTRAPIERKLERFNLDPRQGEGTPETKASTSFVGDEVTCLFKDRVSRVIKRPESVEKEGIVKLVQSRESVRSEPAPKPGGPEDQETETDEDDVQNKFSKERLKKSYSEILYFPLKGDEKHYFVNNPTDTIKMCYQYLILHRYSKISVASLRMLYKISLAGFTNLTKICMNFGYLADDTGDTLLSIGSIREGKLRDLKLLCLREELPSFTSDKFSSKMNHGIPDIAWKKARILCPCLCVHIVLLGLPRYNVATRFYSKNTPLASFHLSTGYRGVKAHEFRLWYFDMTLKVLVDYSDTLVALSFYIWHSRERLDNLVKKLLVQLVHLQRFEYYGTFQYIKTIEEICQYFLNNETKLTELAIFKIEDPCSTSRQLAEEIEKRRVKFEPFFKDKKIKFHLGTFSL